MKNIAKLSENELKELFQATSAKIKLREEIVEKDFWVCFLLDHLFNDSVFRDFFVFKGGTSLSKAYHVIERFSEDIDLILDWRKINYDADEPWQERSRNKQDSFNKQMNATAADFYKNTLIPKLNEELESKLNADEPMISDPIDPMVVLFRYPTVYTGDASDYIRSFVKLEIGPIAEWLPSHDVKITPFAAEKYPALFTQSETSVRTVDVERTFWEKITILHKIAHFPETKTLPSRYARHLYDVYRMANSPIKEHAFSRKELLARDVLFKQKFYYTKNANYENATLADVQLIPNERVLSELEKDYAEMKQMIYGEVPPFSDIIGVLKKLEMEIHNL